ncbi:hypothetical protein [Vulcanisaeta sp. JCM 16161]|uniref:hypothetical protein n=1 Tax=Vulcanisaeta sp. JCM 16161 TaxID=1295372 RepID=UPI000A611BC8|nr:hypothetical protein [Vulcanisaeta sp. JCM 16161]
MCTIGGVLIFGDRLDRDRARRIEEVLRMMIVKGEERGRDSFGIVILGRDGELSVFKSRERPSIAVGRMPSIINEDTVAAIFNNRAEPTTEYVRVKTEDDIQPMIGDHIVVAHNGTIANDKDLEARFNLTRRSKIDTAILPPLLEKLWDGSLNGLRDVLVNYVIGSYALAIMDTRRPGRVWLATNFKPLYMAWYNDLKALFFASLDDYLIDSQNKPIWDVPVIRRVEPYTAMEVGIDGTWSSVSLRREEQVGGRGSWS